MNTLFRKCRSAARLLAAPGGLGRVGESLRKNARRAVIRLQGDKPFLYTRYDGSRFVCTPGSMTSEREYERCHGHEEVELEIALGWLRPGDACLDLGANIGLMSASFASRVGADGLVVSVEPAPTTHALLRRAMELLGHANVRLEQVCVSDVPGEVPFMVSVTDGYDTEASMKVSAAKSSLFREAMVPSVTIDSLIEKHAVANRLALVKIDIEGAEPMGLSGAGRLFGREDLPMFAAEVQKVSLANFNYKPMDVLRFFPTELFELYHVRRSTRDDNPRFEVGRLYPLPDPAAHEWPWYSNLVAVPRRGRYADRRAAIAGLLV
ncbi:MAG: FkbM family methyltransferase [Planctomycetes bacterium]|nr:FkbM family methyltransferase [Planctomycetota bacterium]